MNIKNNVTELVGNTPSVFIQKINTAAKIALKLEGRNPAGSIKDRVALNIIEDAEKQKIIIPGKSVIIEPTSGNTGIGLAMVCAVKDYRLILTMPDNMSIERRKLLAYLGAELVLTNSTFGMKGAIEKAEELHQTISNSIIAGQFVNKANPEIHYKTTAQEIWNDTDGKIDIFVAGVGTGGTITGIAQYLKEKNPLIKIVAVEPFTSAVLSGEIAGKHGLQGIGAGFIPEICDTNLIDKIVKVKDNDAIETAKELAKKEGILAGISAGAAVFAALEIAKMPEYRDKFIVTLLPDSSEKYLSTSLFE